MCLSTVYACMTVSVCVCVCLCAYVYMNVLLCAFVCVCVCVCACVCVCMCACVCVCMCACVCSHSHACICVSLVALYARTYACYPTHAILRRWNDHQRVLWFTSTLNLQGERERERERERDKHRKPSCLLCHLPPSVNFLSPDCSGLHRIRCHNTVCCRLYGILT